MAQISATPTSSEAISFEAGSLADVLQSWPRHYRRPFEVGRSPGRAGGAALKTSKSKICHHRQRWRPAEVDGAASREFLAAHRRRRQQRQEQQEWQERQERPRPQGRSLGFSVSSLLLIRITRAWSELGSFTSDIHCCMNSLGSLQREGRKLAESR